MWVGASAPTLWRRQAWSKSVGAEAPTQMFCSTMGEMRVRRQSVIAHSESFARSPLHTKTKFSQEFRLFNSVFVFLPEMFQSIRERKRRCLAQAAHCGHRHYLRQILQRPDVFTCAFSPDQPSQDIEHRFAAIPDVQSFARPPLHTKTKFS